MLNDFWFNVKIGINHVLDFNGYDHVLFLVLLAVPYIFKHWKRVFWLVSLFTFGHTLSLVLASYNKVSLGDNLVESLIPITILLTAIYNIFTAHKKDKKQTLNLISLITLGFGLIHGLGFAREFKMLAGQSENKLELLIAFALGIEVAQIIIVFIVLVSGFVVQTFFRCSKRDWVVVLSSIVLGLVLPLLF
ncbi:MAG: HupE/UreJ family protein [Winogradskyella sp.]